jgi:hypothetical protein
LHVKLQKEVLVFYLVGYLTYYVLKYGFDKVIIKENMTSNQSKQLEWVHCDKCHKWRKLPHRISAASLANVDWTCSMNTWNPSRATCDAPQEDDDGIEPEITNPAGLDQSSLALNSNTNRLIPRIVVKPLPTPPITSTSTTTTTTKRTTPESSYIINQHPIPTDQLQQQQQQQQQPLTNNTITTTNQQQIPFPRLIENPTSLRSTLETFVRVLNVTNDIIERSTKRLKDDAGPTRDQDEERLYENINYCVQLLNKIDEYGSKPPYDRIVIPQALLHRLDRFGRNDPSLYTRDELKRILQEVQRLEEMRNRFGL